MKDRQAIYFNESGYELELKNYREKKTLESLILTEFKKLTPDHKFKPDFNNDVMNSFYSQLEGEHSKHNPLKIRGAKLCELMELDTKMLKSYSLQYKRFVDIKSPRKDTFTIYAHTEKELYKLDFAKRLIDNGILVSIDPTGTASDRVLTRNLPFYAGSFSSFGIDKELALSLITLNPAKILGIDNEFGTLEVGKSATLFISKGDALDIMSNNVTHAFISGRNLSLETHQTRLWRRYSNKYSDSQ